MDKALLNDVIQLSLSTLQIASNDETFDGSTALIGSRPEFDSMAVVGLMTAIEDYFDITIHDDEISVEIFETFGTLTQFIGQKIAG